MAKKKFYAVAAGRKTGIFTDWPSAESQVKGFAGAKYKSFPSRAEAESWLDNPVYTAQNGAKKSPSRKATQAQPPIGADALVIYTDGGSINNPGPGGYGVVICDNDDRRELSGGFRLTTNNRMEMTACLEALRAMGRTTRPIVLYSDSSYLVNGITKGWAKNWRRNGWRKADRSPALNSDLWAELLDLLVELDVEFRWVRGHAGNELNERCDRLAVAAARAEPAAVDHGYERDNR